MIRILSVLAAVCLVSAAHAQSVKLKASEISALLTGNTAIGQWDGKPYRQYFAAGGVTIIAREGTGSSSGEWRIDAGRDEYQSLLPSDTEWEGWFVMEYLGAYFWVSKSTPPTPFEMLQGQRLAFVPE